MTTGLEVGCQVMKKLISEARTMEIHNPYYVIVKPPSAITWKEEHMPNVYRTKETDWKTER